MEFQNFHVTMFHDMSNVFMSIARALVTTAVQTMSPEESWTLLEERFVNSVAVFETLDGTVEFLMDHGA